MKLLVRLDGPNEWGSFESIVKLTLADLTKLIEEAGEEERRRFVDSLAGLSIPDVTAKR